MIDFLRYFRAMPHVHRWTSLHELASLCAGCGATVDHPLPPTRLCLVTTNPCGSDTWAANWSCPCVECQSYLAERLPVT